MIAMPGRKSARSCEAGVVLDIGGDIGALIVYAPEAAVGSEIEISPAGSDRRSHNIVRQRPLPGPASSTFAAVFPALPAGDYVLHGSGDEPPRAVTVTGAAVTELYL
jgi:hypothetical protein